MSFWDCYNLHQQGRFKLKILTILKTTEKLKT